jgi:hypothetical protein
VRTRGANDIIPWRKDIRDTIQGIRYNNNSVCGYIDMSGFKSKKKYDD